MKLNGHCLIVGRTASGKTTLAVQLVSQYAQSGIPCVVLDPIGDKRWEEAGASFVTSSADDFLKVGAQSTGCSLFIDESGENVGRYNSEMFWLATRARHLGHRSHFITQRAAQLSPTVRDQCLVNAIFACSFKDSKILSEELGNAQIRDAHLLPQGTFLWAPAFGEVQKMRVF